MSFWSEHSDRAGVDSWLAALGVDGSLRAFVGRWSRQGAEDLYVRTAVRITENLQRLAAAHARASLQGGPDFFGEEHLFDGLRAHLLAQQVAAVEIEAQIRRLKVANFELAPTPLGSVDVAGNLAMETTQAALEAELGWHHVHPLEDEAPEVIDPPPRRSPRSRRSSSRTSWRW